MGPREEVSGQCLVSGLQVQDACSGSEEQGTNEKIKKKHNVKFYSLRL
jgi:hypothetical protein